MPNPQPAKALLALRRISIVALAEHVGVTPWYLGRILNGYERPSARVTDAVSDALGEPVEALFRAEDLEPRERHPGDETLKVAR